MLVNIQVWSPASCPWIASSLAFPCTWLSVQFEPFRGPPSAPDFTQHRRWERRGRQTMGRKSHPPPALGSSGSPHRQRGMFVKTKSGVWAGSAPLPRGEGRGRCAAEGLLRRFLCLRLGRSLGRTGRELGFWSAAGTSRAEVARLGKEFLCLKRQQGCNRLFRV